MSFCAHAILGTEVMLVPATLLDPRFADNPLITGLPRIRFYAGCPLCVAARSCVRTLCLIDTRPHDLAAARITLLQNLGSLVQQELVAGGGGPFPDMIAKGNRQAHEGIQVSIACYVNGHVCLHGRDTVSCTVTRGCGATLAPMGYIDCSGHVHEAHQDVEISSAVGVPSLCRSDDLSQHLTPPEQRTKNR